MFFVFGCCAKSSTIKKNNNPQSLTVLQPALVEPKNVSLDTIKDLSKTIPFLFQEPTSEIFVISVDRGTNHCDVKAHLKSDPNQTIHLSAKFTRKSFYNRYNQAGYQVSSCTMSLENFQMLYNLITTQSQPKLTEYGW